MFIKGRSYRRKCAPGKGKFRPRPQGTDWARLMVHFARCRFPNGIRDAPTLVCGTGMAVPVLSPVTSEKPERKRRPNMKRICQIRDCGGI